MSSLASPIFISLSSAFFLSKDYYSPDLVPPPAHTNPKEVVIALEYGITPKRTNSDGSKTLGKKYSTTDDTDMRNLLGSRGFTIGHLSGR